MSNCDICDRNMHVGDRVTLSTKDNYHFTCGFCREVVFEFGKTIETTYGGLHDQEHCFNLVKPMDCPFCAEKLGTAYQHCKNDDGMYAKFFRDVILVEEELVNEPLPNM